MFEAIGHSGAHKFESIVFDFDGTLAELRLDFNLMRQRLAALAERYLSLNTSFSSQPVLEWLETVRRGIAGKNETAGEEFQSRASALVLEMELAAARNGSLFPFTKGILDQLKESKIKTAIITRNCRQAVKLVFPDLDRYCSVFLAREDVTKVKPDPHHLLLALGKVAAAPQRALMVGDHPLDIQTGKNAGTMTAGVLSGRTSQEDLLRSGADWTARDCDELMTQLRNQRWI